MEQITFESRGDEATPKVISADSSGDLKKHIANRVKYSDVASVRVRSRNGDSEPRLIVKRNYLFSSKLLISIASYRKPFLLMMESFP